MKAPEQSQILLGDHGKLQEEESPHRNKARAPNPNLSGAFRSLLPWRGVDSGEPLQRAVLAGSCQASGNPHALVSSSAAFRIKKRFWARL